MLRRARSQHRQELESASDAYEKRISEQNEEKLLREELIDSQRCDIEMLQRKVNMCMEQVATSKEVIIAMSMSLKNHEEQSASMSSNLATMKNQMIIKENTDAF